MNLIATVLYAAYAIWLCAGLADFVCHRRADLAHTSGVHESALHLLQLALIGTGFALALMFEFSPLTLITLGTLAVGHAMAGYLDTRSAYGARTITPLEQHLHSILDMGPPIALAVAIMMYLSAPDPAEGLRFRMPVPQWQTWTSILAPALLLCVMPALLEFHDAWRVRADRSQRTDRTGGPDSPMPEIGTATAKGAGRASGPRT